MIIYISIPMQGKCMLAQRRKALMWQKYFEILGHTVINPFEIGDQLKKCHLLIAKREPTYHEYLQEDLCNLEWASHIFLCNGWTESFGCMEEVDKSIECNLKFLFERNFKLQ